MAISALVKWALVGSVIMVPMTAESPLEDAEVWTCRSGFSVDRLTECRMIQVICTDREHRIVYKSEAC